MATEVLVASGEVTSTKSKSAFTGHRPKPKNVPKEFVFVEVAKTGRVTDKKHLHNVRKHIMKDIGMSRRKKVPTAEAAEEQSQTTTKPAVESDIRVPLPEREKGGAIPRAWTFGSGRTDPFACYPVAVDTDMLFLIDHGKRR